MAYKKRYILNIHKTFLIIICQRVSRIESLELA